MTYDLACVKRERVIVIRTDIQAVVGEKAIIDIAFILVVVHLDISFVRLEIDINDFFIVGGVILCGRKRLVILHDQRELVLALVSVCRSVRYYLKINRSIIDHITKNKHVSMIFILFSSFSFRQLFFFI